MTDSSVPTYTYRVVTQGGIDILPDGTFPTEAEAQAHANALMDKNNRYRDLEVERVEKVGRGYRAWLRRDGEWTHSHYVRQKLTREEIRAREEEQAKKPRHVGPQTFIGTFSRSHYHPNTGQSLRFGRVQFQAASREDAFDLMWDAFGDRGWYDAHPIDEVAERFRKEGKNIETELWADPAFRVSWPTPPEPPGETVTLRLRVTPAQAAMREVWIAGRCILHRPSERCEVNPGAGVRAEDGEYHWHDDATPGVGCAGLVLHVRFFRLADAERAVASDPENISIVEGSKSFGTFRRPRKVFPDEPTPSTNQIRVSGVFTLHALEKIASADSAFNAVYDEAAEAHEALGDDEKRAFGVEILDNRIVAIHVKPED